MVVFTCNHCGDSLKKPKVAIHYQQVCRKTPFLTCVDCLKDFRNDEYMAHTKCITEAERYGAKDYVPKPNANKNERKQQEWINVIYNLTNKSSNITTSMIERHLLNMLAKHENVPRKKVKFINFVCNAIGNRMNISIIESIWDKIQNAYNQTQHAKKIPEKNQTQNKDEVSSINMNLSNLFEKMDMAENQNNENICKEKHSVIHQVNGTDTACDTASEACKKRNKSKKRHSESNSTQIVDQTAKKIKLEQSETSDDNSDIVQFEWKQIIRDILQKRGEISFKKLQNKVMTKCIYHIFNLNNDTFELSKYDKAVVMFNKTIEFLKKSNVIYISCDKVKLL